MASRTTNSLAELLQKFSADLAQYKLIAPDDELPMIQAIEDTFLQVARAPIENMAAAGTTQAPPSYAGQSYAGPQPGGVPGLNMVPGPNMMQ